MLGTDKPLQAPQYTELKKRLETTVASTQDKGEIGLAFQPAGFPSLYTLDELRKDALKQENADLALMYAIGVAPLRTPHFRSDYCGSVLYWLMQAKKYQPDHPFFGDPSNTQAVLDCLGPYALDNIGFLFEKSDSDWLLNAFMHNSRFNAGVFGYDFYLKYLNERCAQFLKETRILKYLTIRIGNGFLSSDHLRYLFEGLNQNSSVDTLNLDDQLDGDGTLQALLDAIQKNPENNVRYLELRNCHLTNKGAQALLNFVLTHPKMEYIKLDNNPHIDNAWLIKIEESLHHNRSQLYATSRMYAPHYQASLNSLAKVMEKCTLDEKNEIRHRIG